MQKWRRNLPVKRVRKDERRGALWELAGLFLKLGTIAFGGPAAHIAMMEDEVVRRRRWLTREEFLDLLGATNLIPGPNSTEMAIHVGHRRAGFPGLLVAGSCFIVPAMLIVLAFAWSYARYGDLPQVEGILYGVKPVIIAVVFQALWGLAKSALKTGLLWGIALAVVVGAFFGASEIALLFAAGAVMAAMAAGRQGGDGRAALTALPLGPGGWLGAVPAGTAVAGAAAFGLWPLFWFFLKVGSVLYGSGYVLLAFLEGGLVERFDWLTEAQLLDAVSVGQVTPGPVFTTATFIGYLLGGVPGALVATLGIFLPAFIFVALSGPLIPRIRKSKLAGAFLDGVNAASLALMAVVTFELGRAALVDWVTIALAAVSGFLLLRYRLNSVWLVALGGAAGFIRVLAG